MVDVPDGTYTLTASLQIGSNTHLKMSPATTLVRAFPGTGETNATIRNKDFTSGNTNIKITGGVIKALASVNTGKHLMLVKTTYVTLDGVRFDGIYNDWNAAFRDCQDVVVSNVVINAAGTFASEDGLHFYGGRRIVIANCDLRCGDDCLSFTCENLGEAIPIEDVVVSNCYCYSRLANAVRLSVATSANMFPIRRVQISNIVAKCGDGTGTTSAGLSITGPTTSTMISDIDVDGVSIDASQNKLQGFIVVGAARVRLSRVIAKEPAFSSEVDGCSEVVLRDCTVDSPRQANTQCLLVARSAASSNVRILGGLYRFANQDAIVLGVGSNAVTGFEVSGVQILGDAGTLNGINFQNASGGTVIGNSISGCSFSGISEATSSTDNTHIANRLIGNGGSYNALVLNTSGTSQAIRNVTNAARTISDTGGFRQTVDGWNVDNVGANVSIVEVPRTFGRFRALRKGSVTGLIVSSTEARTAGTLTAYVYKSSSPGAALFLAQLDATSPTMKIVTTDEGDFTFTAGEELYVQYSTSSWSPTTADIRCGIEIVD